MPPPARASSPALATAADPALSAQLRPYLAAILRVYAQSSQAELARCAAPRVRFDGLGGEVTFAALVSLSRRAGLGPGRSAVAIVRWSDPANGAGLTRVYRLQLGGGQRQVARGGVSPDK